MPTLLVISNSLSVLLVGCLVWSCGYCQDITNDLINCSSTDHPEVGEASCSGNGVCNLSANLSSSNVTTYKFNLNVSSDSSDESCLFFVCHIDSNDLSNGSSNRFCALYESNCSLPFCGTTPPMGITPSTNPESGDGCASAVTGLVVFIVILFVALIAAIVTIVTLVLMVREMQSERIEQALPNPYSCIFPALCSAVCSSSDEQLPKKVSDNKKKDKSSSPPKHHRRQEEALPSEDEGPDHDADDYEEMKMNEREGSFTEGDDVYQNY